MTLSHGGKLVLALGRRPQVPDVWIFPQIGVSFPRARDLKERVPCRSSSFYVPALRVRQHHLLPVLVLTYNSSVQHGKRQLRAWKSGGEARGKHFGGWLPHTPFSLLSPLYQPLRVSSLGRPCSFNGLLHNVLFEGYKNLSPHQSYCFILLPVLLFSRPITPCPFFSLPFKF